MLIDSLSYASVVSNETWAAKPKGTYAIVGPLRTNLGYYSYYFKNGLIRVFLLVKFESRRHI